MVEILKFAKKINWHWYVKAHQLTQHCKRDYFDVTVSIYGFDLPSITYGICYADCKF